MLESDASLYQILIFCVTGMQHWNPVLYLPDGRPPARPELWSHHRVDFLGCLNSLSPTHAVTGAAGFWVNIKSCWFLLLVIKSKISPYQSKAHVFQEMF